MNTRKIKDAKDLSDDSLIYFKSHAKATYMSDGSTVEDTINNIKVNGGSGNNIVDWKNIQNKPNVIFDTPNEKGPVCIGYDRLIFPDNGKLTSTASVGNFTLGWTNGISWLSFNGNNVINHEITAKGDGTKLLSNDGEYKEFKTINGNSILGSGDIAIQSGGGSGAYALVEHGTNDTTFTLTPNTFHTWGEVSSLILTLGEEQSGVANEYLFQFTSGTTATTLSLPSDLKWANDSAPTIDPNMIYQVSILKGLASVLGFSNVSIISFNINVFNTIETHNAEEGMTWEEWVNSKYNTKDYQVMNSTIIDRNYSYYVTTDVGSTSLVSLSAVISAEHEYGNYLTGGGGGGV